MRCLVPLLLLAAAPAAAADRPHSGAVTPQTAPLLSDLALGAMAVAGIVVARRAMRARHRKD